MTRSRNVELLSFTKLYDFSRGVFLSELITTIINKANFLHCLKTIKYNYHVAVTSFS